MSRLLLFRQHPVFVFFSRSQAPQRLPVCFIFSSLSLRRTGRKQDHGIDQRIDYKIMEQAKDALENKTPVSLKMPINNLDRTTGTILSYNISTK